MKKRYFLILPLAALAYAAWPVEFTSIGIDKAGSAPPPVVAPAEPAIRVVAAERREIVETLSVTGTVVPREEAHVGTDLNGLTVLALEADQGDRVRKGDILAVLDRSSLDTQLAQADANRAQAEAAVEQARAQIGDAEIGVRQAREGFERAEALRQRGVAAQAQLDNAVNAYDSAKARLVAVEKALAASQAQLAVIDAQKANVLLQIAKTELRAPADGIVLARNATLGGVVSAAGGPLFRIAVGSRFELAARVPETSLALLEPGMKASVVLAGNGLVLDGEIRLLAPEVDQASRLGTVRIALPDDAAARAGNFARGEIVTLRRAGIAVPASALLYRGGQAILQRVRDGVVETVEVRTGARDASHVEILEGLDEGDEVVARAGTFVAEGDRVRPVSADAMEASRR